MTVIKTAEIQHLIRLAVMSAYVKDERAVSVILCAPPEHAKTELLKKFSMIPSVHFSTNFDTGEFMRIAPKYPQKRTIIIPDFLRVTKRKSGVVSGTLSILNAVMEEGWHGNLPLGQTISKPITMNIITGITDSETHDKRRSWVKTGFLSRFIPISYSYSSSTKNMIRQYIKDRMYTEEDIENIRRKGTQKIELTNDVADILEDIAKEFSEKEFITGFRLQRQLQTMAMTNALLSRRTHTIKDDAYLIREFSKYINFDFEEI